MVEIVTRNNPTITFKDGSTIDVNSIDTLQLSGGREALRIVINDTTLEFNDIMNIFSKATNLSEINIPTTIIDGEKETASTSTYFDYSILISITDNSTPDTKNYIVTLGQYTIMEKQLAEIKKKLNDNQGGLIELAKIIEEDK